MIAFVKVHACGNDFLIVEHDQVAANQRAAATRALCARNTGVGADGVEYFEWLDQQAGRVHLYNADGSSAEISGNGTRCVAAWMAHQRGLGAGAQLRVETEAGWRECNVVSARGTHFELVSVMGIPRIQAGTVKLSDGLRIEGAIVNVGNPHFVLRVNESDFQVAGRSWQSIGLEICSHIDFPAQTNVEFLRILSPDEVEIRIFERGVGPTNSSGTGTCAAATTAIALHGCRQSLRVIAPGGAQQVNWDGQNELHLTGPAELVSFGHAYLEAHA